MKLSVITTYRKRIKNFMEYAKHVGTCKRDDVEFILVSLGDNDLRVVNECKKQNIKYHYEDYSGMFSNGHGHNIAANIASGEWMFKLDVDCIPYVGFFDKLIDCIDSECKSETDFLNIGCYFMYRGYSFKRDLLIFEDFKNIKMRDVTGYNGEKIGGMLYVINRNHYLSFGGTPKEFIGFGWEDYYVIYVLQRLKDKNFKLSECPEESLHVTIRKEIARPVNEITNKLDLVLVHLHHKKDREEPFYKRAKDNRLVLLDLVRKFDERN